MFGRPRSRCWPDRPAAVPGRCHGWHTKAAERLIAAYPFVDLAPLTIIARDEDSGWIWVQSATGREGWVPDDTVEPLA